VKLNKGIKRDCENDTLNVSPASGRRSKIPWQHLKFLDEKTKIKCHDSFALDYCETKEAKWLDA